LDSTDLATGLEEPLVATSPTSAEEDQALIRAVSLYRDQSEADQFQALESFLSDHPQSGWRVAVLTNLGLSYYHYGYFSKTIAALEEAWNEGRDAAEPHAKALVDRAVGELLRMHARLGHSEQLAALFEDIGERALTGPATETEAGARHGLWVMQNDPGVAYLCGPMALKNLLLARGTAANELGFLDGFRSSPQGVSLAEVGRLADQAKLTYHLVYRDAGEPIPVPSIVHWKVSHFAAIIDERDGYYQIEDPTFGHSLWITRTAIESEASGYFLAPGEKRNPAWREVGADEASRIRGMGFPEGIDPSDTKPNDDKTKPADCPGGMCDYNFTELVVSLNLSDRPVGYAPPKGPPVYTTLTYNQREAGQPANFSFFNIGPKWTLNWLSYIQDDPSAAGINVTRYVAGGGSVTYAGYNATTRAFAPETRDASILVRTSATPIYERQLADGSTEVYARSDGATTFPRRIFLTQIIDSAGNAVALTYDVNRLRLTSLTDGTGRSTTFSYGLSSQPLLVTAITDPFGRSATLTYDGGRLSTITDVLPLTSSFHYDAAGLVDSMKTPYGTTSFAYGDTATADQRFVQRFVQATDPLGHTERLEYRQPAPGIPTSDPDSTVPAGIIGPFNLFIDGRNTFYWDKHAYQVAPAGNYTMARIKHWTHLATNTHLASEPVESIKYPLENRIWFNYPGQENSPFDLGTAASGTLDKPTNIGRVLDDGTTQLTQLKYNGAGNPVSIIDPLGRQTLFDYDPTNQIDLLTVRQKTAAGSSTIGQFTYNSQHLPLSYTDAAGQPTLYAYNSAGQLTQMTDPLGDVTTYQYDGLGYLISIVNANNAVQASFTYDDFSRVATHTDSEGWTIAYTYDAMDRLTSETYPDGTSRTYTWDKLDVVAFTDRQGRTTAYTYDAVRNLVAVTDPLGTTHLGYYENQELKTLTDPNGNTTTWDIDVQSRVAAKHYPDRSTVSNTFEATTSRLKAITDALGQTKQYAYARDNRLTAISYLNAVNATPNVQFGYDAFFPRIVSMTDGSGTTQYRYVPVGSPGALQPLQDIGPFQNATIGYQYDALGRVVARAVGGNTETFSYDPIDRVVSHNNDLGAFAIGYLGQTNQATVLQSATVGTGWAYHSNLNDRRLKSITNSGIARGYQYTTTPENLISGVTETSRGVPVRNWTYGYDASDRLLAAQSSTTAQYGYAYDPADNLSAIQRPGGASTLTYNGLNQIRTLNGVPFSYDANGNLVQDDQRTYRWDAENRLIGIGYKAQPSKHTTFRYDGLGRRIAITTTNGTVVSETRYLWCGEALCQARTSNDAVTRRYFSEGEELPGAGTLLYYARDHLGSVRDLLVAQNGSLISSYDYDPYGSATQESGRLSGDFRYAGMFYHQDSGLYLTHYRAYDPRTARWLSRDPIGELTGGNLYEYVSVNPLSGIDPLGLVEDSPANRARRQLINKIANDCNTKTKWAKDVQKDDFPAGAYKCSKFICDVLDEAGVPVYITIGKKTRCATTGDWVRGRDKELPNWRRLRSNETPMPGDIAAYPLYPSPGSGYFGHAGIFTDDTCGNMSAHDDSVHGERGQFDRTKHPDVVYRRYTGE
jgi:RHS repeat-associated protein